MASGHTVASLQQQQVVSNQIKTRLQLNDYIQTRLELSNSRRFLPFAACVVVYFNNLATLRFIRLCAI